jgi:hypothetical protein
MTTTALMDMRARILLAVLAFAFSASPVRAETATLFRVFLNDGTALVSYGEYARVGDRVVFSMPVGVVPENSAQEPDLHVVNIPAKAVNWSATSRYAEIARYAHYVATTAEPDYAALTGDVAAVLNAIVLNKDPQARLAMAVQARRRLASWPRDHYGYRAEDVREVLGMLDEVISAMRAAAGATSFSIDLVADTLEAAPLPAASILPPPTSTEIIAQTLAAARVADAGTDRVSLLKAAVTAIDKSGTTLPKDWGTKTRKYAVWALKQEVRAERQYGEMSAAMLSRATHAAAKADVRAIEGIISTVMQRDVRMGQKRPSEINTLIVQIQVQLDAARQLQLVRDRWKERIISYRAYLKGIAPAIVTLARSQSELDNIKRLAGSDATDLVSLMDSIGLSSKLLNTIGVPDELKPAHSLLVSAMNLAETAIRTRRAAVMSGELRSAWDASSAAAGSMTLFAKAQEDMEEVVKLPQLR